MKGVAFRSVLAVLAELQGEATLDRMLGSLPPESAKMLRYSIVQTGWYPISLYREMWAAILDATGGSYDVARAIGAGAIRRDMTGVYRLVFKLLSPETLFSLGGKMFSKYYDTGTCLLYTSPSPRDISGSRMPSSA